MANLIYLAIFSEGYHHNLFVLIIFLQCHNDSRFEKKINIMKLKEYIILFLFKLLNHWKKGLFQNKREMFLYKTNCYAWITLYNFFFVKFLIRALLPIYLWYQSIQNVFLHFPHKMHYYWTEACVHKLKIYI